MKYFAQFFHFEIGRKVYQGRKNHFDAMSVNY